MLSPAAQEIVGIYRGWRDRLAAGTMSLDEVREMLEHWADLGSEPEGVAYLALTLAGVPCIRAVPKDADTRRVLLCCHGGGYVVGSAQSHRKLYAHIARQAGCEALILDYTRAPEKTHPGQLEEAIAVYAALLEKGSEPAHIAVVGDSAGANMAAATVLLAGQSGHPAPAACVTLSPWFDMGVATSESLVLNAGRDALVNADNLKFMAATYLAGKDPLAPLASPLQADLAGFPPTLMQVGDEECLLDDSRRFLARARAAGVDAELQVFPGMQHVFHMLAGRAPEADDAIARMARWLRPRLGMT